MEEIKFRAAKSKDVQYLSIMSKHIQGGAAFASLMFPQWFADESWLLFVAEAAPGDVIGFAALNVRDCHTRVTVWSIDAIESKRKAWIFGSLARYSLLACQQRFPSTKSVVALFSADTIPVFKSFAVRETFDSLTVRWCLDPNTSCFQEVYVANVKFCSLYENGESVRKLFPSNNIVANFTVYDANMLESRVYLDNEAEIIFLFTSASASNKLALSVVGLLPQNDDMQSRFMATVNFYGTDIKMMKYQATTVINMVSKIGMELGKNELVLQIGIHGYPRVRHELVEFITERNRLELLQKSELVLTDFGMSESFGVTEQHNLSDSDIKLLTHKSAESEAKTLSKL